MTGPGRALAGRRILAVFAHPDDESLTCGGTLARAAAEGARVSLLCATRGEAGERTPGCADGVSLGTVRRGELHEAATRLGIADVTLLDHPDGSLTGEDYALFRQEIVLAIRHVRPEIVLTFGPEGLYWHPDHIFVHERVTEAVQQSGADGPALYYAVFAPGQMRAVLETAQQNPGAPADLSLWHMDPDAFGAYGPAVTLVVDATAYVDRKIAALHCHRSQVGADSPFSWLTPDQAARLLGREYFARSAVGPQDATFLDDLRAATDLTAAAEWSAQWAADQANPR